MESYFLFICFSKKSFKRGKEIPSEEVQKEKNVFYLNDFYDLLYEKENTVQYSGTNPPEYFESEKYYTMGPKIDFPIIMSYKDTENPNFSSYYYFLNGHNDVVYFADANFIEEQIEAYEYNYFGIIMSEAKKNYYLFESNEFDPDLNLYFNNLYKPDISYYIYKKIFIFNKNLIVKYRGSYNILEFILKENVSLKAFRRLKQICCTACWIAHTILALHCLDCLCCLGTCGWQCYDCE